MAQTAFPPQSGLPKAAVGDDVHLTGVRYLIAPGKFSAPMPGGGLVVYGVHAGLPAAVAGLRPRDVFLWRGAFRMCRYGDPALAEAAGNLEPGVEVRVTVSRDGVILPVALVPTEWARYFPNSSLLMQIIRASQAKHYEAALKLCRKIPEQGPEAVHFFFFCGQAYALTGKWKEAEKALKRVLAEGFDLPQVHGYLAQRAAQQGRAAEAQQEWAAAKQLSDSAIEAIAKALAAVDRRLANEVEPLQAQGKWREGFQRYQEEAKCRGALASGEVQERLIKLVQRLDPPPAVPEEARRHFGYAMTALEQAKTPEELDKSIAEWEEALRAAPWWPEAYFNFALVLERRERYAEAARSLQLYLLAAPNAEDAAAVEQKIFQLEYKAKNQPE